MNPVRSVPGFTIRRVRWTFNDERARIARHLVRQEQESPARSPAEEEWRNRVAELAGPMRPADDWEGCTD